MVVPAIVLVVRSIAGEAPSAGWLPSVRQWGLLMNTAGLAGAAVCVSTVCALPAAYAVGQCGRLSDKPLMVGLMVVPLLLPPMVYAFGWQRLITLPGHVQCVWVWSAWAWPIPALIIGSGWSRFGRGGYEAALLSASAWSAFLRVALPVLLRYVATGCLVLLVLFMGEYSVPHACGLNVYATDLLGLAESYGARAGEVLWPSMPLLLVLAVACGTAWTLWRRSASEEDVLPTASTPPRASKGLILVVAGLVLVTVVVPIVGLAWHPSIRSWMAEAWRTYHVELLQSIGVSVASGVVAVAMGAGLALWPLGRGVGTALALAFGILPGALIGQALVVTYLHVSIVYDHWPIVVLSYVARFGWVGMLVGYLAVSDVRRELVDQARADGADEFVVDTRVRLYPNWPVLASGILLVAALSLADVTAITLVRIPSIGTISLTLIEKMHRFEDSMLASLSLWLVLPALPSAVFVALSLRRKG